MTALVLKVRILYNPPMIETFGGNNRGSSEAAEIQRVRLQIFEGPRGSFQAEKKEASARGLETIDPRHARTGPAVSQINTLSKQSLDYTVCTGLLMRGYRPDGQAVSFITHMVPTSNPKFAEDYKTKLRSRLIDFSAQTDPSFIQPGFFAGEKSPDLDPSNPFAQRFLARNEWYRSMRDLTYAAVRETIGREPQLLFDPSPSGEHRDIFLDTSGGKLYIERY
jgi:hypothetical protein